MTYSYSRERDDALAMEAMTDGEYHSMALAQYADAHGSVDTTSAWILSPFDSWERNPHYVGPAQPHPEDDYADADVDEDAWTDELESQLYSEEFGAYVLPARDADDEIPF